MRLLIILTLLLPALTLDYEQVLQSPTALRRLFSAFASSLKLDYSPSEAPLRMRLFRDGLRRIVRINKEYEGAWTAGVNKFTVMTGPEKQRYLGLNMTRATAKRPSFMKEQNVDKLSYPVSRSFDWRAMGRVTGVKNQGVCGSCWAFSAVATIETGYAVATGKIKEFSEQELVDCTYEEDSSIDGCDGGMPSDAFYYSVYYWRLATRDSAPYRGFDTICNYHHIHNGYIAARMSAVTSFMPGEAHVIGALSDGAVSVLFEVTDDFFEYKGGIHWDNTCADEINHAVTAVGYTPTTMIVKNSWGQWGDNGYFHQSRNHHGCGIWKYGTQPYWAPTGKKDWDQEYVPTDEDDCEDDPNDTVGCPCGTVLCDNGQCRHVHMCGDRDLRIQSDD